MSKSIRVDDETYAALTALKGDDETFDELLARQIGERCETIREGAGLWSGTGSAEGAREAREQTERNLGIR